MKRKLPDASERIRQLKERVKAGNLPYFDPLADGRALEYDRALAHHYGGFKARALASTRLARCSSRRAPCVELLRLLHGGVAVIRVLAPRIQNHGMPHFRASVNLHACTVAVVGKLHACTGVAVVGSHQRGVTAHGRSRCVQRC